MQPNEESKQKLLDLADEVINIRQAFPGMYEEVIRKTTLTEINKIVNDFLFNF